MYEVEDIAPHFFVRRVESAILLLHRIEASGEVPQDTLVPWRRLVSTKEWVGLNDASRQRNRKAARAVQFLRLCIRHN
jgi:hypothetical protein